MARKTITAAGKKASATIFCSGLIVYPHRHIIYLEGYGPTQEVRAFAQVLKMDGTELLIHGDLGEDGETREFERKHQIELNGNLRIIPDMGNGYTGIIVTPMQTDYIIGDTQEECFEIFSRILDQEHFVHRDWYEKIFAYAKEVPMQVGERMCYFFANQKELIEKSVVEMLKWKAVSMPPATADLKLEVITKEAQP